MTAKIGDPSHIYSEIIEEFALSSMARGVH
jgi:hypothetical protein